MKGNLFDGVSSKVDKGVGKISNRLVDMFYGSNPYDTKPMDNDELLLIYENLSSAELGDLPDPNNPTYVGDIEYLIEKYGRDAVSQRFYEIEQIKSRRMKNA